MSTTTISIDTNVRDRLKRCGAEHESYNSIIERLLDIYEKHDLEQYEA
jgi:predicted CopG family antitoxin